MAHILSTRKRLLLLQVVKSQRGTVGTQRSFSTSNTEGQESTTPLPPPPTFDYQAPKDDDSYRNYQSTQQFIRRYLVIFPLAAICLYDWFFVRKNEFSSNREFKFVNRPVESLVGRSISKKIMNDYKSYIYKQDTEEV